MDKSSMINPIIHYRTYVDPIWNYCEAPLMLSWTTWVASCCGVFALGTARFFGSALGFAFGFFAPVFACGITGADAPKAALGIPLGAGATISWDLCEAQTLAYKPLRLTNHRVMGAYLNLYIYINIYLHGFPYIIFKYTTKCSSGFCHGISSWYVHHIIHWGYLHWKILVNGIVADVGKPHMDHSNIKIMGYGF